MRMHAHVAVPTKYDTHLIQQHIELIVGPMHRVPLSIMEWNEWLQPMLGGHMQLRKAIVVSCGRVL